MLKNFEKKLCFLQKCRIFAVVFSFNSKSKIMESIKKSKSTKKSAAPQAPPKKKISKFGQMMGSYPDIKEIGNVWDL